MTKPNKNICMKCVKSRIGHSDLRGLIHSDINKWSDSFDHGHIYNCLKIMKRGYSSDMYPWFVMVDSVFNDFDCPFITEHVVSDQPDDE
jgi:hypothetical protein